MENGGIDPFRSVPAFYLEGNAASLGKLKMHHDSNPPHSLCRLDTING